MAVVRVSMAVTGTDVAGGVVVTSAADDAGRAEEDGLGAAEEAGGAAGRYWQQWCSRSLGLARLIPDF
jgi:hypothetical protein